MPEMFDVDPAKIREIRGWKPDGRKPQITATVVAQRAGISRSYLSEIEHGKKQPTRAVAKDIAKGLKVKLEDIASTGFTADEFPEDAS